jgi:hypothetical protein
MHHFPSQMNDAQGSAARPGFRHSAARSVRLPSHKSRHLIEGLPLDAFGQLRPLAEFNLLQKRNGDPRGDHATRNYHSNVSKEEEIPSAWRRRRAHES